MLPAPLLIPPSADFWPEVARALLDDGFLTRHGKPAAADFAGVRVVVPGAIHGYYLKRALAAQWQRPFLPPRVGTLAAWLSLQPPAPDMAPASHSERLMEMYAALRQHGWIKKLFSARRNTDLLPLAQTLIALFDELTRALLPALQQEPETAAARWQAALEQLPPPVRGMLSNEAQLVWTLWQSQLDARDPVAADFHRLQRLAQQATEPLIWIQASQPDAYQQAFLEAYAQCQPVQVITLDWRAAAVHAGYATAWPELLEGETPTPASITPLPVRLAVSRAASLEEEAQRGAQTVIDWLREGKEDIAIIAQDRAVARRMRALLERACVQVADETGWKLSTTRAAAAVAAWLDVVTTRAETLALLDLLKSPFVWPALEDKAERVMRIERALRRYNIAGGWEAATEAMRDDAAAAELIRLLAEQAAAFGNRKTLCEWMELTQEALRALDMLDALQADGAGAQVLELFDTIQADCRAATHAFSFGEWRAFLSMQLESAPYLPGENDRRVVMLQLSGTQLRSFDAVLMVGADAEHLPSQQHEALFFANAVRRELGLPTREQRHCLQLRDFAELLSSNPEVVLSWQTRRNGEPNAVSNWIARLQLALQRAGLPPLPAQEVQFPSQTLTAMRPAMPTPAAPQLLPRRLSASAYNLLVVCPYQFFATRMLGLAALEELSELPEKRDYGEWLHAILKTFHETLRDRKILSSDREPLLRAISEDVFGRALDRSAAALGYYARWQKAIPAYLAWVDKREAEGWRFVEGEKRCEKPLHWDGGSITLHGVIDRIDEHESGTRAVLDYKAKALPALVARLKEGEDHQLAFYGLLSDAPVAQAHYVALEVQREKTGDAEAPHYDEWQRQLQAQIVRNLQAIAQGAALQASGIERHCQYCDVRGLCRKGGW